MKLLICTQAVDQNHPILAGFHGWFSQFAAHFDEVHIICLIKGDYNLPQNVHVYSLGKEEGESHIKYLFRFYKNFSHIFFRVKVDFVFFHQGYVYNLLAAPFFLVRRLYHTKFYWWKAHGHINFLNRFSGFFVDNIFTSTASGFPIETPKRVIVGQAIDAERFTLPNTRERSDMIFVGRVTPIKHLEIFLETYVLFRDEGINVNIKIIGPLDDSAYAKGLKQYCAEHAISEEVFVGSRTQTELVDIYQHASIFLNTSSTHSMDKTVLESMLCGCIPVTGNNAFRDMLSDEGLYVENATAKDYVKTVRSILSRNDVQVLREKLSAETKRQHSLTTITNRIFGI